MAAFAGLVARRWEAFPPAAAAYLVTAWWLRTAHDLPGEDDLLYALTASLAVGCAVGLARQGPARPDTYRRVAAAVAIVGVLGALVVSTGPASPDAVPSWPGTGRADRCRRFLGPSCRSRRLPFV